ncbi:TPA: MFS transporter [Klebsiella pneumoniae]|uniref:MFS transporter n=1 Tax=Klebsiella TaxID=570 RepID=UPI0009BB7FAB|nr:MULTISPECIES: MFS transporter [Klebsiella]MCJ8603391.1 MFS transporter [Klebsiella pneumoniae]MDE4663380.1 MFS transporter [Klebsiella pneumoniae]MDE4673572.1 MFS transporter [Klebsiella pneumoniae]MDE4710032.1 MFS transporter [Klebsiella pneumoniae]MDK1978989.1 MFS transporter [Klebsiella sp. K4-154]
MNAVITSSQRRALRALSIAYFVQATGALSVAGSLPAISAAWQLTDAQSARLLSIFGLTFALAAPLVQVLFGHLRRRRLVLTGIALFGLGAFAFVLSPGYNALLASRILMGAGAGFIGPVLVALGSELVHEQQRGRAIGMVLLGVSMASLAGIPIASWVAGLWGAKALFALVGVVSLLSGLNILLTVPDDSAGTRIRLREMAGVLADGKYLTAFLVVFFITSGVYSFYAFIAPLIRDTYTGGTHAVSAALAVLGVAGVLGNLWVTRAATRFTAEKLLLAGMTLLIVDTALIAVLPKALGVLLAALVVWAFATDLLWPSQQRRIVELASVRHRGIALALTSAFMFGGIGFGSAVASWIYPVAGFYGLAAMSVTFIVLALCSLQLSEKLRKPVALAEPCQSEI